MRQRNGLGLGASAGCSPSSMAARPQSVAMCVGAAAPAAVRSSATMGNRMRAAARLLDGCDDLFQVSSPKDGARAASVR